MTLKLNLCEITDGQFRWKGREILLFRFQNLFPSSSFDSFTPRGEGPAGVGLHGISPIFRPTLWLFVGPLGGSHSLGMSWQDVPPVLSSERTQNKYGSSQDVLNEEAERASVMSVLRSA